MYKYLSGAVLIAIYVSSCWNYSKPGSNGIVYKSPLEYNNYIMARQKKVVEGISVYTAASQGDFQKASFELNKVVGIITDALKDIHGMSSFDGDSSLKVAAVDLFSFYKKSFSSDFREMLTISEKVHDSTITDADIRQYKNLQDGIAKVESPLDEKMKESQVTFAKAHNLKLSDHSIQDKIDNLKSGIKSAN